VSAALVIRDARPGDEEAILTLLREFAEFEKLTHIFRLTREIVLHDFIGAERRVQCEVAESDGATMGVMTWFRTYSTFAAAPGVYLEDIFVRPSHRGKGIGTAMLKHLARRARTEGATRINWSVLDWNHVALDFYASIDARPVEGWLSYDLSGDALQRLASA
jgi:GNAT superfamily N-acetyltransferase